MEYLFCQNCERPFPTTERHRHEYCGTLPLIIDWENFAFCMGYPRTPDLNKKYPIFHLDLYKRLDSDYLYTLRKYDSKLYKEYFEHWKKITK